jgi:hypothetical protein
VGSVVLGGIGTMAVVAGALWFFPELKQVGRLTDLKPLEIQQDTEEELRERQPAV